MQYICLFGDQFGDLRDILCVGPFATPEDAQLYLDTEPEQPTNGRIIPLHKAADIGAAA